MKKIKMWYARWFKVIEREQAIEWGLTYQRGVYGDEINHINCRSIWTDKLGRLYRVRSLYSITHNNCINEINKN